MRICNLFTEWIISEGWRLIVCFFSGTWVKTPHSDTCILAVTGQVSDVSCDLTSKTKWEVFVLLFQNFSTGNFLFFKKRCSGISWRQWRRQGVPWVCLRQGLLNWNPRFSYSWAWAASFVLAQELEKLKAVSLRWL